MGALAEVHAGVAAQVVDSEYKPALSSGGLLESRVDPSHRCGDVALGVGVEQHLKQSNERYNRKQSLQFKIHRFKIK